MYLSNQHSQIIIECNFDCYYNLIIYTDESEFLEINENKVIKKPYQMK